MLGCSRYSDIEDNTIALDFVIVNDCITPFSYYHISNGTTIDKGKTRHKCMEVDKLDITLRFD